MKIFAYSLRDHFKILNFYTVKQLSGRDLIKRRWAYLYKDHFNTTKISTGSSSNPPGLRNNAQAPGAERPRLRSGGELAGLHGQSTQVREVCADFEEPL